MTDQEIAGLGPAFSGYLRQYRDCFLQKRTATHFDSYCRGLLSDLPRKSVEPIALACGTAVRTLQEFLVTADWAHERAREAFQRRVAEVLDGFRVAKSEAGLAHYEGRQWVGLVRHLVLSLVVLGFVSVHTDRLRGEKPARDDGAGVPGAERQMSGPVPPAAWGPGDSAHQRGDPVPSAA